MTPRSKIEGVDNINQGCWFFHQFFIGIHSNITVDTNFADSLKENCQHNIIIGKDYLNKYQIKA